MADWVTRVLKPHVDEVIRCQPQFNKLISKSEDKCDTTDSESLSELLYLNRLKRVHHPELVYRTLREAVRAYWIASREVTRAKNRVKAFFLFNGLRETGDTIYCVRKRSGNLAKLEKPGGNAGLFRVPISSVRSVKLRFGGEENPFPAGKDLRVSSTNYTNNSAKFVQFVEFVAVFQAELEIQALK